ncbi:TPA: AI-2E family transporter [Streptococcus equi subsp. zooepidemicus]|uniref:Membrane protein n=1 Tax=Streptococcus equi subsp. ruminatorum CECT 5772 TaxID=1051981 RepID=A0A922NTE9_9STRE|nr:AI-2E family transporter [Streptococcus equi]HEL0246114.1 AI-2E family transporter [Streptococcus equi subsp. zooepidemicus]HEL1011263.1 AI-2E family transporter [Streptococcus equi subsp. ruminatorum]KED03615.1 membrane protein [Streptococcus equi subsp. ruminatorum CECT 5772]HEL0613040.1 AI-2E family transporter [Streptococcus equi subsp. zooepidemicus]HEL1023257.1 AI-2E family transporter [Streptococcus equi subsp. ruminatorum CECT 5772]
MSLHSKPSHHDSLFYKWFLNNQAVMVLLITLLVFLTIFVFTKISFLFTPIVSFLTIIMLPMVISTILYYLIKPLVDMVEKLGPNRTASIFIVFGLVILLFFWAISGFIPMIQDQLRSFVEDLPKYVAKVNLEANKLLENEWLVSYRSNLQDMLTSMSQKALDYAQSFSKNAIDWAGNFAGAIARITVAIIMSPFILFYFLRDSGHMKNGLVNVLPIKLRQPMARVLGEINQQLSGYVQGQVTVAIVVGLMFSVMFSLVGLKYSITFGIIAGFLNMIPYLGSFLAMIPVVIMGMVQGPLMLIKVLIIFVIEQTIEGRFVAPLVLGNKLSIHPITIMFLLLTAGSMFGVWGVFLVIPVYASVKVVVKELFDWYKDITGLYEEKPTEAERIAEDVK